jgi:hypothetical protein
MRSRSGMLHRPNYVDYVDRIQAGREKAKEDVRRERTATISSRVFTDDAISTAVDELPVALIRMQSRRQDARLTKSRDA